MDAFCEAYGFATLGCDYRGQRTDIRIMGKFYCLLDDHCCLTQKIDIPSRPS